MKFQLSNHWSLFYRITSSIIDRHNVKKILTFLEEFHSNKINSLKLDLFKSKFDQDKKYRNDVLETILLLNERFIDVKTSQILANLFIAHIEEKISWEKFLEMSFMLNNLNPSGYVFLEKCADKESHIKMNLGQTMEGEALLIACGIGSKFEEQFRPTKTGISLYELGIKPLKNTAPNNR